MRKAFPQTHPDRLAALARLFGVASPDVETCRVLELGCACGDNLIPMALSLPNARFVGLDYSQRQIEEGQRNVAALGLSNIELRHADIADVDASCGSFDYIVAHGVYSWVPAPIREKVLAICKDNLAPSGIAFVSYNTFPGWQQKLMVRETMMYHSAPIAGAANKVAQSRALLDFLAQNVPADTPYGAVLRQEVALTRNEDDAYLFHDHLEEVNHPVYFHEFAQAAQEHGLQYVAETDFGSMLLSNLPRPIAAALKQVADDVVRLEQNIDFFLCRAFRQTLLAHRDTPMRRKLEAQSMRAFHFASVARPASTSSSYAPGVAETFAAPGGAALTTGNAITKAALATLAERWPLAVPFAELADAARDRLARAAGATSDAATLAKEVEQLSLDLLRAYAANVVELRVRSPRLATTASARPIASPLARLQAAQGRAITNLRHEPASLDDSNRRILCLLDGTRDRDALVATMEQLVREGVLQIVHEGRPLATGPRLPQILRSGLDESLKQFARAGLLIA